MDDEEYLDGGEYETVDSEVPQSQHRKSNDPDKKNIIENTGSGVKNTGKAVKKTGEGVEKVGQGMQKAGDALDKAGKTTEKVGKGVEKVGKGVENAGKVTKATGTATDTAGKATEAAGTALGAIPYAGVVFKAIGTVGGKTLQGVGKAEKVGGTAAEVGGKTTQAGGKGIEGLGKGTKGIGKGLKSSGKSAEETGKKIQDAGEKIEKVGSKIEDTGKEVHKFTKATKTIYNTAKNLWKYVIIFILVGCFLGITMLYNQSMSPITETVEGFKNYEKSGIASFAEAVTNLYMGLGFRTNQEAFYNEMEKYYNKSNGTLDLALVISAISYTESENTNSTDYSETNSEDDELLSEISEEYESDDQYTRGKILRFRKLAKKMINSDESDEEILVDYVLNQSEFKSYFKDVSEDSKEAKAKSIVYEIYERKKWYTQIYGEIFNSANAEDYSTSCTGGVDVELANDEEHIGLPVKIPDGFNVSFEGDYAYGIRDGIMHNGLDINGVTTGSKDGDDVFAIADGEVISSEPSVNCNTRTDASCTKTAGAWVRIKHSVTINKNTYNFISVYMHLQANSGQPNVGTKIKKGEKIGKIGNTGDSSGSHLHFEFRVDDGSTYGTPVDPVNLFIKCSSVDGFDIHNTTLTKNNFVLKLQNYCNSNNCSSGLQIFVNNAELIYTESIKNNVNPELVVVRAMSEGFSPGIKNNSNNYWGIGCTNTGGLQACHSYSSLSDGIKGFANVSSVKNSKTAEEMMATYAYIGDYWYNPGDWSGGGCVYFPSISIYLSSSRVSVVSSACAKEKACSGSSCLKTISEDQSAYAKWQVEDKMGKYRKDIFGL